MKKPHKNTWNDHHKVWVFCSYVRGVGVLCVIIHQCILGTGGLNDRQRPICVPLSISRASFSQWEGVGWAGWALLPNPGASHSGSATISAGFLLPFRRWSWYFTMMAFGIVVLPQATWRRGESCNMSQSPHPSFWPSKNTSAKPKRAGWVEPNCCTHLPATSEIIALVLDLPTQKQNKGRKMNKYTCIIQINMHMGVCQRKDRL